jgi:hypothetical protein
MPKTSAHKQVDGITGQLLFTRGTPSWTTTAQGRWTVNGSNPDLLSWFELEPSKKGGNPTKGLFIRDLGIPNLWDKGDTVVAKFRVTNYELLSDIGTTLGRWSINENNKGIMEAMTPFGLDYKTIGKIRFIDTTWIEN